MREILFRGKTIKDNKWVKGFYEHINWRDGYEESDRHWMYLSQEDIEINGYDIEGEEIHGRTIGQYAGLKDKNGTKIFDGDIVKATVLDARDQTVSYAQRNYVCLFWEDRGRYVFDIGINNRYIHYTSWWGDSTLHTDIEVIGNIHDNPELLKEGD